MKIRYYINYDNDSSDSEDLRQTKSLLEQSRLMYTNAQITHELKDDDDNDDEQQTKLNSNQPYYLAKASNDEDLFKGVRHRHHSRDSSGTNEGKIIPNDKLNERVSSTIPNLGNIDGNKHDDSDDDSDIHRIRNILSQSRTIQGIIQMSSEQLENNELQHIHSDNGKGDVAKDEKYKSEIIVSVDDNSMNPKEEDMNMKANCAYSDKTSEIIVDEQLSVGTHEDALEGVEQDDTAVVSQLENHDDVLVSSQNRTENASSISNSLEQIEKNSHGRRYFSTTGQRNG